MKNIDTIQIAYYKVGDILLLTNRKIVEVVKIENRKGELTEIGFPVDHPIVYHVITKSGTVGLQYEVIGNEIVEKLHKYAN